ncbi:MAG: S1 RNA-binding domain-containing protein [Bacillota bacterium]|nr:S1 RNA-binding domain-containing protein [Bacillota bacterium]
MGFEVGMVVDGKITGITKFGAFVALPDGKSGMIHVSEISNEYVKEIRDYVKEGDTVKAKVISIDNEGRISLSIKQLTENKQQKRAPRPVRVFSGVPDDIDWSRKTETGFEDMMSRFKQDSDEKISAIRRNFESKRGTSYKKRG